MDFPDTTPIGETAATGAICPCTGWWECVEQSGVQGGRRQLFRQGERFPHAVLLGPRSLWDRLTGAQPTHRTVTVWTLKDYDPPLAAAQPPEPQETHKIAETPPAEGSDDDDTELESEHSVHAVQPRP